MNRLVIIGTWLVLAVALAAPLAVSAEQAQPKQKDPGVVELPNPFVVKQEIDGKTVEVSLTIQQIIGRGISVALGIMGSIALAMFFYGGYLWLISGGSSDRIKKGKETLIWATVGLAIIFGSGVLVQTVIDVLETK